MNGKVLFIKHIETEGPGHLESFFVGNGVTVETVELSKGEGLLDNLSDIDLVATLGGPMNVYEENKYPFLAKEDSFIKKIMDEGVPFLGICLGAQLLAKACGASVFKSPKREIGWYKIGITPDGEKDLLFQGLNRSIPVFQLHEDTFDIPSGGLLLVRGRLCKNQAFKIGAYCYGLQFHVEVTEEMVESWIEGEDISTQRKKRILADLYRFTKELEQQREILFQNLLRILHIRRQKRTMGKIP